MRYVYTPLAITRTEFDALPFSQQVCTLRDILGYRKNGYKAAPFSEIARPLQVSDTTVYYWEQELRVPNKWNRAEFNTLVTKKLGDWFKPEERTGPNVTDIAREA